LKNGRPFLGVFLVLSFILFFFRLEISKAYDDSTTLSSYPYLVIPDGEGYRECGEWVEDIIYTTQPPEEAIVLSVDITFTISHPCPSDLVVILQYDDTNFVEPLWDMDGQGSTYTKTEIWSFYGLKANTHWKLRLEDCYILDEGTLVSWTLTVRYHVPPDPPASVWAYTGFGPREIDLYWTPVNDIQCSGYRIEGNRDDDTLTKHNVTEVERSVYDCNANFKTIDLLACADSYYFRIRTISTYNFLGRPSSPLAEALSSYCQNVDVVGSLKYVNYDDLYAGYSYDPDTVFLPNVLVTVWRWNGVTGDSFAVPPIYTNIFSGTFFTTLVYVNHPIYFRFQLVDQSESLAVFDNDSESVIFTYSDTLGPDNSFDLIRDEASPYEQDMRFARASYSFDYIQQTKKYVTQYSSWDTPPVQVWYDYDNEDSFAVSGFDSLQQRYWMLLTSRVDPDAYQYKRCTPTHEHAHLIHLKAWDINSLNSGCPLIHSPDTPTSGYCALVEGWAEFISCIFKGDRASYLEYNYQDLEYNDWWVGTDGTNENGSFVEGAVASAWYDMEDYYIDNPDECSGTEYYELSGEFANIFRIFRILKPQDMVEFMNYWQNDPNIEDWGKEHLVKIFSQHYIFKPGDANTDGNVSVSDIAFLVNYLFKQGPAPDPSWVGDANGDCNVSLSDTVYLISYLFKQGPEPIYNPDC
jgi:hypothetical protein